MFTKDSVLLHIPHSSYYICPEYRDLFYLNDSELKKEQLKMTDSYTEDLFDLPFPKLVFPVSRLLCVVERFRDDEKEIMSKRGMGVCYSRTSDMKPLKRLTDGYVVEMMQMYDVHHRKFEEMVAERLRDSGYCLIIDCHSFSSTRLAYEDESERERPDICIGMNREFHRIGADYFIQAFEKDGYSVDFNYPFSGSIVPEKYYEKDNRVASIMIEINRALYMDEMSGEKLPGYQELKENLHNIICEMPETYKICSGSQPGFIKSAI